jgi:SNF2 family DNA or RNA helicase
MQFSEYTWPMMNSDHKPFAHQIETTKFLLINKQAFVLSDMGTGKTLCPLWASDFLMVNNRIKRVLIVSPLSTMQAVWGREIFRNFPHRKWAIAHGSAAKRTAALKSDAEFVIINHDGVKTTTDELIKAKFDVVIIDELTAFKNPTSERTKAMCKITHSIIDRERGVWGMTGEPTPNGPTEAFGQARVVNPRNPNLPRFFKQFQNLVEYEIAPYVMVPKTDAAKHVFSILQPSIRYTREQCVDIPECLTDIIEIKFSQQQHDMYQKMKKELLIEYEQGLITASNAGVKAMKLLQISAGAVKDDDGGILILDDKPRMDFISQTLDEMGKHKKLVIFSSFRAGIAKLEDYLTKEKIKVRAIHGSVAQAARGEFIRMFQDEDLEALVIQPQSCAHGVTLTESDTVLWHSLIASGEIFNQANARITRIGQKRKQYVRIPWGSRAEYRLIEILQSKNLNSRDVLEMFEDL